MNENMFDAGRDLLDSLEHIKKKLMSLLGDLRWCEGGRKIIVEAVAIRGPSSYEILETPLSKLIPILQENINIVKRLSNQIEPYVVNILIDNTIYLSRVISIVEDAHRLVKRAEEMLNKARMLRREEIISTLRDVIAELTKIVTNEDLLIVYLRDENAWSRRVEAIELILDKIWRKLVGRETIAIPPLPPVELGKTLILFGKEIGRTLISLINSCRRRIYIFSQAIHSVKIWIDKRHRVNLLKLLLKKADEGVDVRIISKNPCNIPGIPLRYLSVLAILYHNKNIKHRLCWYMHMKVILIDDVVLVGSANFTSSGLDGFGEIALVIRDKKYVDLFDKIFNEIYNKEHAMCKMCPKRELGVCGDARRMLLGILQEQLRKAVEKKNQTAINIITNIIDEIKHGMP